MDDVLTGAAVRQNDGAITKKPPAARKQYAHNRPIDHILKSMQPINLAMSKLSDGFYSNLQEITEDDDKWALRTALRSFIVELEVMYRRI